MVRGRRIVPLLLAVTALGPAAAARATPGATVLWGAYGGDAQLTNHVTAVKLTPATAPTLGVRWRQKVDTTVLASPLLATGVVIGGTSRTVLYAATEAGSVYAIDAATGLVLWKRTFGTVEAGSNCGTMGISSTGAIDGPRGLLYVIGADGALRALDLATGASPAGWPLQIVQRTQTEYVWGGLRIVGERLLVPVASYCDQPDGQGPAEGGIVAVDLATQTVAGRFDTVPGPTNLGGVWGWAGTSVEPDESFVYTAVGNSVVHDDACDCLVDDAGFGDSVVRLTPALEPVEFDRPPEIPSVHDYDFGAAPVLFQPEGCEPLAAANNKNGLMYVWRRHALAAGHIFADGIGTTSGAPFLGQPSWSPDRRLLLDAGARVIRDGKVVGDGVNAYTVGADCTFAPVWQTVTGSGTQPPPLIVGDVVFALGGSDTHFSVLDLASGKRLWIYDTGTATQTPAIAAGDTIYTADADGVIRAFAPGATKQKPMPVKSRAHETWWVRTG